MNKKYNISKQEFQKKYSLKIIPWLLIANLIFNLAIILNGKWNLTICCILTLIFAIIFLGIYQVSWKNWKSAYVEICDNKICYYRKVKDGEPESGGYEFEDQLAVINKISDFNIKGTQMHIYGNIDMSISYNKNHLQPKQKSLNYIKIPMYFENQDELVKILKNYIEK